MVEKLAAGCCTTLLRRVYSTSSAKRSIRNVAIDTRSKLIIFYFLRWWIVPARKKIKFLRHVVNKLAASRCTTPLRRVYSAFSSKRSVRDIAIDPRSDRSSHPSVLFAKVLRISVTRAWKILARIFELVRIFGSNLMIRSRGNRTARRAIVAIALIARSTYVPLRSTDY